MLAAGSNQVTLHRCFGKGGHDSPGQPLRPLTGGLDEADNNNDNTYPSRLTRSMLRVPIKM